MDHIKFLKTVSILVFLSACAPSQGTAPTAADPTPAPSGIAATATTVPPSRPPTEASAPSTPTIVPATPTAPIRHPIPLNFPLATFEMTSDDGRWTLTFRPDGSYEVTLKAGVPARGAFDVIDDRLTLHDVSGSKACKPAQGDGTYRWAFDGTVLELGGVSDKCLTRAATLSGSVWRMQR